MKKKILVLVFLLLPIIINAQATGNSKIAWDEGASDLITAQGYIYKYYPDNAAVGITFTNVTCTGTTTPFTCVASFPAFTPGTHTIILTASDIAGESAKTSPFSFSMIVIPGAPSNIRIQ